MRLRKTPEEKAALQARKQQKLAAWQARSEANRAERKRRYEEKHNPVTQARLAFERGDPVFQYELHGIFDDQNKSSSMSATRAGSLSRRRERSPRR